MLYQTMNTCICCHGRLLRHLSHHRVFWFCPGCHQKMPNIDMLLIASQLKKSALKLQKNSCIDHIPKAIAIQAGTAGGARAVAANIFTYPKEFSS